MLSMNVPVDEFITPDPVTAREDMSIDEVRSLMDRHDIRHLQGLVLSEYAALAWGVPGVRVEVPQQPCAAELSGA